VSEETREEKERYIDRLFDRMTKVMGESAPDAPGWLTEDGWEEVGKKDRGLFLASVGYLSGDVSKEDLDKAAASYLKWFRDVVSSGKYTRSKGAA